MITGLTFNSFKEFGEYEKFEDLEFADYHHDDMVEKIYSFDCVQRSFKLLLCDIFPTESNYEIVAQDRGDYKNDRDSPWRIVLGSYTEIIVKKEDRFVKLTMNVEYAGGDIDDKYPFYRAFGEYDEIQVEYVTIFDKQYLAVKNEYKHKLYNLTQ
jgi:hypothetical protein